MKIIIFEFIKHNLNLNVDNVECKKIPMVTLVFENI